MIRDLRPDDRAAWQRLYEGYQAFYGFPDRPRGFYDKAFARLMARDARDFRGLVFDDGTGLLGLTHYVFHPNLWRDEGVCYLQDLFTDPQARGRGVARALRPGGVLAVTFSNRCFPTKAVAVWQALDGRDQCGLVALYLRRAG